MSRRLFHYSNTLEADKVLKPTNLNRKDKDKGQIKLLPLIVEQMIN